MTKRVVYSVCGAPGGLRRLALLAGGTAKVIFSQRTPPPPSVPQVVKDLPLWRYHDLVTPRRLDAWSIICHGGACTIRP